MSMPKSVVKIRNGNVTYTSNVDRVQYTLRELTRAALKDTGRFICSVFRKSYYDTFHKRTGKAGKGCQYWVRSRDCDLQVGIGKKGIGFYSGMQEVGSSKSPRYALLRNAVNDNTDKIKEIQSKYLSALEDEGRAAALIDEKEKIGDDE